MKDLKQFFSPKSIAIVGASPKKISLGNVLAENIKKGGWRRKLYFVNPKYAKFRNDYLANLNEIGKPIDLVLVAIPAPFVANILEDGIRSKPMIGNYAIISSGFKESGTEGKILEDNLEKLALKRNLNILGPNCLGFANPVEKLNATFTDMQLKKGRIAVISQSGALAVALLDWAESKNIGFSKIISIGNKTILDESAILDFLEKDSSAKAIALYLEDIKHGREFMQAAAKITPKKPVIILKAGKTSAGQKAISSHTGSLAQDAEIIEAVFEKLNVIAANNIEEFQDIVYYLSFNAVPTEREVVILTNAGGPGVMASDFIGKSKNIKLLNFAENFRSRLKKHLPASASVENPIDVIGDASPERYENTLAEVAKSFPKNPILVILTPQNQTDPEKVAQILIKYKKKIPNLCASFMGGRKIYRAHEILEEYGIPVFENPERALLVIEKLARYQQNKNHIIRISPPELDRKSNSVIKKSQAEKRKILFWRESEKLFRSRGVKLAKSIAFKNLGELKGQKMYFPCALKTDDPTIAHRLEKNAVMLGIQNEKELRKGFELMKKTAKASRFIIQLMVDAELELIIGMKNDPIFGPIVLCGFGGSYTEIFRDKIVLIPPFDRQEIKNSLSRLAIFPVLKGFRGKKGYDLDEISNIVMAVAQISLENPQIREIDINPLVLYNDGRQGQILDAKIFLS